MANPAPTINQINAFNATQGTTIDFNIIGGTELIRSNRIYIYDLSDNSLICTHLYVSTESIHELPPNTDGSIVYESGKSSADFVNGAQYYAQIQTYTDTNGTQGGSGLSVAKMFWCLVDPTLTITTIPSTISTTSYNISATYTDTSASVVSNIIQQYQFNLYSATGSLLQSSGVVVGSGTQQGTSDVYDISYNFTGLNVGSSYYVTVDVKTTQGMSVNAQSNTFTVSIDTPTLGEATVVNNACDGYISVTSNLSGEYGGSGSGEIVSFETDSEDVFSKLQVDLEPIQEGSGDPSPSNVRPIRGHSGVDVNVVGKNLFDPLQSERGYIDDADGELKAINSPSSRSTGWIPVIGGETYFITSPQSKGQWGAWYDENKNYISGFTNYSVAKVAPNNAAYIRATVNSGDGNPDYATNVMIAKGGATSAYEPYIETTITQDFNATLTPTSTDTTPYLFKVVGDIYGDRLEDKIVGGTVAWNQLVENGDFSNGTTGWNKTNLVSLSASDGVATLTLTGTPTANYSTAILKSFTSISTHKYLVCFSAKIPKNSIIDFDSNTVLGGVKYWNAPTPNVWTEFSTVCVGNGATNQIYWYPRAISGGYVVGDSWQFKNSQVIDLTQMFGSTIADYIYSLEQSQAGAGVAWFKKLFPNDYYAYNAGELLSVEGLQSHDAVGFNQWDEEWELGTFNTTTGVNTASSSQIRSKNLIPILPNTTYYFKTANNYAWVIFLDADKNVIEGYYASTSNDGNSSTLSDETFVTPPNGAYMKFYMLATYGTTYNHDICINLSNPSRNGEYEPYEKHSYPLDSSLTLRGIPKLDASNNLYYDGDEYTSDGKVKRKYGVVDLGSLNWSKGTYSGVDYFITPNFPTASPNGVCPIYTKTNGGGVATMQDKEFLIYSTGSQLFIVDSTYTDIATFKAAMSGVMLVYELATPTTETAEPYTNPQIVSKYGTLEYVTNSIVPVGHKTTYLTRDIFGGYVDLISGKLVVDKAMVDMGSLNWTLFSASRFWAIPSGMKLFTRNLMSSQYAEKYVGVAELNDGEMTTQAGAGEVYVKDTRYTTATEFKSAVSGQQLVYELATPQTYQLTPQQVNTLVGTNNVWSEQGNIELSYHIPITNLLVKRQDVDDVSGGWLTLYSQPITQASDMDFTFIDFLNQYGKTYKYALVPLLTQTQSGVEVEVEGGYTVSDEVQSVFDGVFIADSTGSQKCKANVGYGNVDMNQVVGSITPIGAKYPIIITNSHNQYHNGSISGTIVPDDYYFNGNLSRIDMVKKRNELEQFLTNKRVKVIKDWNGNIWLVMIVGNVSCTFNNNYGMGIVSFSTNWTEVGDPTNQQDLQATGLINVGGV